MSQLQSLQLIKHDQKYTVYGYCRMFAISKYDIPIALIELILSFYKLLKIVNKINQISIFELIQYILVNATNFYCFNFTDLNFKQQIAIGLIENIKDIQGLSKLYDNKSFNGCLFTKNECVLYTNGICNQPTNSEQRIPRNDIGNVRNSLYVTKTGKNSDRFIVCINKEKIYEFREYASINKLCMNSVHQTFHRFIISINKEELYEFREYVRSSQPATYYLCIALFDRNDSICYKNMIVCDSEHIDNN